MSLSSSPDKSSDAALQAAGVCTWDWSGQTSRIRVWNKGKKNFDDLEGDWCLEDFLTTLDGLSARRLSDALTAADPDQRIDHFISLADGREFHFLGSFLSDGQAHGLLLSKNRQKPRVIDIPVVAVFQPIIRLEDGMIAGFEALARWRGEDGEIRAASAIQSTEERLVMEGLALSMLEQAGRAIEDWSSAYPDLNLFVQVNLSGADLYRSSVLEKVSDLVQSGRIPANALRVELTEQMALRDFDAGVAAASALNASGAVLVLDDFGSGHSSLAWLASIPVSGIKIDSQLTQLPSGPRIDQILKSVTELARSLDLSVTAEGIEDFDRVQFLKDIGCNYVQGFAYAYPMEKAEADRFLENQISLFDLK